MAGFAAAIYINSPFLAIINLFFVFFNGLIVSTGIFRDKKESDIYYRKDK